MPYRTSLVGQHFGKLKVITDLAPIRRYGRSCRVSLCRCACGTAVIVTNQELRYRSVVSCGCFQIEIRAKGSKIHVTHGHARKGSTTSTYTTWRGMLARCLNPKRKEYPYYGGRGIRVCDQWLHFEGFLRDMGEKPKGMTLDRKRTNGHYTPENCRWATPKEQALNRNPSGSIHRAAPLPPVPVEPFP